MALTFILSFGIQFHPELDKEALITRIKYYKTYVKDKQELDELIKNSKNSPEAIKVLSLFVDKIILEK